MREFFNSRIVKQALPYMLLVIGGIIAWFLISEFGVFLGWLGVAWIIITPFFYGFILAYILNMPCSALHRLLHKVRWKFFKRISRAIAIVITYVLFAGLIVLALWLIIPRVIESIEQFIHEMPEYYEAAIRFLDNFQGLEFMGVYVNPEPDYYGYYPEAIFIITTEEIELWLQDVTQYLVHNFSFDNVVSGITAAFGNVFSVVFRGVLTFISSVFFLVEKEKIIGFTARMLAAFTSTNVNNIILKYVRQLNVNFKQYIYTQTIDGMILGTLATLVLAFIIQSPYALILGLMLGIINYIPYFGSIFGSLIAVVVVAFTQGLGTAALAAVLLLILQQIDGNVIQPKLMGSSFKISPLLIIVSVTVGGALAGVLGMLAAIPIVAVLRDILLNIINYFEMKNSHKYAESGD